MVEFEWASAWRVSCPAQISLKITGRNLFWAILTLLTLAVLRPLLACTLAGDIPGGRLQTIVEISEERMAHDRQNADRLIRACGLDDTPCAREKTARLLLGRLLLWKIAPQHPCGFVDLAHVDEIVRRFGQDDNPVIRAVLAEALVHKGTVLLDTSPSGHARPLAARLVFDEVERRFGKETDPAIRIQYVRSLLGRARTLGVKDDNPESDDQEAKIAAYDDIVRRFAEDPLPGVRQQAERAKRFGETKNAMPVEADDSRSRILRYFDECLLGQGRYPDLQNGDADAEMRIIYQTMIESLFFAEIDTFMRAAAHAPENEKKALLERAITAYDAVVVRFGEVKGLPRGKYRIVLGGWSMVDALDQLGRLEEAIAMCDEMEKFFENFPDSDFKQQDLNAIAKKRTAIKARLSANPTVTQPRQKRGP